jgi:hypothetical protein
MTHAQRNVRPFLVELAVTEQARQAFWDGVYSLTPETIVGLFEGKRFSRVGDSLVSLAFDDMAWETFEDFEQNFRFCEADDPFFEWCHENRINGLPVYDAAQTFARAHIQWRLKRPFSPRPISAIRHEGLRLTQSADAIRTFEPLRLDLSHAVFRQDCFAYWNPIVERRSEAEERILGEFERRLKLALDEREAAYSDTPTLDKVRRKQDSRHFEWLVQYQVLKKTYAEIADLPQNSRDPDSIRRAISEAAEMVRIELRKSPPGRPPGSRDKMPGHRRRARLKKDEFS